MADESTFYAQQAQNPAVRKLLQTIRYAEGTADPQGYRKKFGGGLFNDFSRHPNQAVSSGNYTSTAAGAYQFLTPTWQSVSSKLGLKKFGPQEQDIAATYLAHQRLKPLGGFAALEKQGLSPQIAAALAPEWASFPTQGGSSYYGQPVKKLQELQSQYSKTPSSATQSQSQPQQTSQRTAGNTYNYYIMGDGDDVDPGRNFLFNSWLPRLLSSKQKFDPIANLQAAMTIVPNYFE